jgi:hypothetical protein
VDAEGARLVAGGGDHAAAAAAARIGAHHHRPAAQGGILAHFDGGVERVEVGVQDRAHGGIALRGAGARGHDRGQSRRRCG